MSSWLRRALLTAVLAGGALILGAGVAGADVLGGPDLRSGEGFDGIEQTQEGSNSNSTYQEASADASTYQVNVNAPIAILSPGSNNGDVDQSNDATTVAVASNWNDTDQSIYQDQEATSGGGCGCRSGGIDQDQMPSNTNRTDQDADATATTYQVNVNAPIAILSPGSNNGDVDQSNDATTIAGATNSNETDQFIGQSQDARAGGHGCYCGAPSGGIDQDQSATNDNSTYQDASADASTKQYNVNAPITVLSPGSNKGDVSQSNDATTVAWAGNSNSTGQMIYQKQNATSKGSSCCGGYHPRKCTCPPVDHGKAAGIDQSQKASNSNRTDQNADANAKTEQKNWNTPISILSPSGGCGCRHKGGGDVDQSNSAFTGAFAKNWNDTYQAIWQDQTARA
jgi:hypothetical protein